MYSIVSPAVSTDARVGYAGGVIRATFRCQSASELSVSQIFVTIVAAEHPARHILYRTTMRASALSPGHSRVLSGPGSGRIARRARRSVPFIRCMTVTDPSFSSPIGGHVDGEPFSLGLRRDADQALILGEPLGRGAMGVVRAVTRKSDGCTFALKTIPKAGPQSLAGQTPTGEAMTIWERKVRDEVSLHFALGASLDIVTLHDGFEDEAGVHLLIDLCDGGDLLSGASVAHSTEDEDNAVVPKNDEDDDEEFTSNSNAAGVNCVGECWTPFSEATAAPMIRSMLRALAACHEHGVVHRDVKPANFLFTREPDGRNRLKLSDFGKFILIIVWAISMTSCFVYRPRRSNLVAARNTDGTVRHVRVPLTGDGTATSLRFQG